MQHLCQTHRRSSAPLLPESGETVHPSLRHGGLTDLPYEYSNASREFRDGRVVDENQQVEPVPVSPINNHQPPQNAVSEVNERSGQINASENTHYSEHDEVSQNSSHQLEHHGVSFNSHQSGQGIVSEENDQPDDGIEQNISESPLEGSTRKFSRAEQNPVSMDRSYNEPDPRHRNQNATGVDDTNRFLRSLTADRNEQVSGQPENRIGNPAQPNSMSDNLQSKYLQISESTMVGDQRVNFEAVSEQQQYDERTRLVNQLAREQEIYRRRQQAENRISRVQRTFPQIVHSEYNGQYQFQSVALGDQQRPITPSEVQIMVHPITSPRTNLRPPQQIGNPTQGDREFNNHPIPPIVPQKRISSERQQRVPLEPHVRIQEGNCLVSTEGELSESSQRATRSKPGVKQQSKSRRVESASTEQVVPKRSHRSSLPNIAETTQSRSTTKRDGESIRNVRDSDVSDGSVRSQRSHRGSRATLVQSAPHSDGDGRESAGYSTERSQRGSQYSRGRGTAGERSIRRPSSHHGSQSSGTGRGTDTEREYYHDERQRTHPRRRRNQLREAIRDTVMLQQHIDERVSQQILKEQVSQQIRPRHSSIEGDQRSQQSPPQSAQNSHDEITPMPEVIQPARERSSPIETKVKILDMAQEDDWWVVMREQMERLERERTEYRARILEHRRTETGIDVEAREIEEDQLRQMDQGIQKIFQDMDSRYQTELETEERQHMQQGNRNYFIARRAAAPTVRVPQRGTGRLAATTAMMLNDKWYGPASGNRNDGAPNMIPPVSESAAAGEPIVRPTEESVAAGMMTMGYLPEFKGETGEWTEWLQRFENMTAIVYQTDPQVRARLCMAKLGPKPRRHIKTLTGGEENDWDLLKAALAKRYTKGGMRSLYCMAVIKQKPGQSIEDFDIELFNAASNISEGDDEEEHAFKNRLMCMRFITGLRDPGIRSELVRKGYRNYESMLEAARKAEAINRELEEMNGGYVGSGDDREAERKRRVAWKDKDDWDVREVSETSTSIRPAGESVKDMTAWLEKENQKMMDKCMAHFSWEAEKVMSCAAAVAEPAPPHHSSVSPTAPTSSGPRPHDKSRPRSTYDIIDELPESELYGDGSVSICPLCKAFNHTLSTCWHNPKNTLGYYHAKARLFDERYQEAVRRQNARRAAAMSGGPSGSSYNSRRPYYNKSAPFKMTYTSSTAPKAIEPAAPVSDDVRVKGSSGATSSIYRKSTRGAESAGTGTIQSPANSHHLETIPEEPEPQESEGDSNLSMQPASFLGEELVTVSSSIGDTWKIEKTPEGLAVRTWNTDGLTEAESRLIEARADYEEELAEEPSCIVDCSLAKFDLHKYAEDIATAEEVAWSEDKLERVSSRIWVEVELEGVQTVVQEYEESDTAEGRLLEEIKERLLRDEPVPEINGVDLSGSTLTTIQKKAYMLAMDHYRDVFAEDDSHLGRTKIVQHEINTGEAAPIKSRPYRAPLALREEMDEMVDGMEKQGVIRKSCSPWASPVVLVKKKDGKLRFCIDYRKLNKITRKDAFPLPRIDELLDNLNGATYYTTLDLLSGYWQIEMREEDIKKTAFISHKGLYEFTVMPFGLTSAPATFQRLMQGVLAGLTGKCCMVFIDDTIVYTNGDAWQHLLDLCKVLNKVREAGLKLKGKKCCFAQERILFLGYQVSKQGIEPNPEKVRAIMKWPKPTNRKGVRSFLGAVGFYRASIKGFAQIALPLTDLLHNDSPTVWGDPEMTAFLELKRMLQSNKVLAYPDLRKPFILYTDASDYCIGAILNQKDDEGKERPIAFASRVLDKAQKNYFTTEKECLAIIWAIRHFRVYLIGARATVFTDHKTLKYILALKEAKEPLSPRLGRWTVALQEYDLAIEFREGRRMAHVDALSRLPKEEIESLPEGEVEFRYVHTITDDGAILLKEKKREQRQIQKAMREVSKSELTEDQQSESGDLDVQRILQQTAKRQSAIEETTMQLDEMIKRAEEIDQQLRKQGVSNVDDGTSGLTPQQMTIYLEAKKLKQMVAKLKGESENKLGRPDVSHGLSSANNVSLENQRSMSELGRPDVSAESAVADSVSPKNRRNERMLELTMRFGEWINRMENMKIANGQKQYHRKLLYTEEERRNLWRISRERQQALREEAEQGTQRQETSVKMLLSEGDEDQSWATEDMERVSEEEEEMSFEQMVAVGKELVRDMMKMIQEDQQKSKELDMAIRQLNGEGKQQTSVSLNDSYESPSNSSRWTELTEQELDEIEQLKRIERVLRKQLGLTMGDSSVFFEPVSYDTPEVAEVGDREFTFPETDIMVVNSMKAEEITELQRDDDELKLLWDYLQNKQLPDDEKRARKVTWKAEWYGINEQGLLVRLAGGHSKRKQRADQVNEPDQRLVVPKSLIDTVLQAFHSSYYGGHFGADKLHATIRQKYFWESMYADCQRFCKACLVCQRYKRGCVKKVPLHPIPPTAPFARVSMDILYTLHESTEGHKYILVFVDMFSKWPEAIPIKDMTAVTVAREFVKNIVCRHGCPRELLSDQGSHFTASVFQEVVKRLGVKKLFNTAYHSQTSGQVERFNGILMQILRCYIESVGDRWHEFLPFALMAYRASPSIYERESV